MFWSNIGSFSRSSAIRRKLKECKDANRLKVMAMRYIDEYYGDATPTIMIIGHVRSLVKDLENAAVTKVIKRADMSTEHLVKECELKAMNLAFIHFREYVNSVCLEALDSIYGDFAGFTSPIISQKQLSKISDMFKSTLPKYYHIFSSLLNKSSKANVSRLKNLQGQWDCDILYQFITLSRKRNPKFFTYWALINTASSYGGTNLDLSVFFGLATTDSTMLKKLNTRYPFQFVMKKPWIHFQR